jgi:ATP-dependent Clp protease ATP-binding subunit ClpA
MTHKDLGVVQALVQLVQVAAQHPARPIIWIPDVHLVRAYDIQNALALALDRTGVKMIGEAPPHFERVCLEEPELLQWIHPIRVAPASANHTAKILAAYRSWVKTRGVVIKKPTLDAVMREADQLFHQRALPGRVFDSLALVLERSDLSSPVEPSIVTAALSEVVEHVPALSPHSLAHEQALRAVLDAAVVGLAEAKSVLVDRLSLWQRGVTSRDKPVASVLLAGPAGVGKSHLARAFAEHTLGRSSRAIHLSCAELCDEWRVDQLLGHRAANPPELRRGMLSRYLAAEPFSLLVIEEIERAHPAMHRWLQRVLDTGCYTDGHDEEVSLRHTFIILSSNAGGDAFRLDPLGVGGAPTVADRMRDLLRSLKVVLPPELLDRLDDIVACPPLSTEERKSLVERWSVSAGQRDAVSDPRVDLLVVRAKDTRSLRSSFERDVLLPRLRAAGTSVASEPPGLLNTTAAGAVSH